MADVLDDDDLPRPFGSYLLLQNFARGGMGEVYLAKSGGIAGLERVCVLKKLRSELTGDREYVTRFVDEARVVVTLNHANICNVFDVGRVAGAVGGPEEYYLAMEYVAGRDVRTLQDRCRKQGLPLGEATSIHLVAEVLRALDYAHRRKHPVTGEPLNLVHRDVSPQNVLVSYEGEVKLIDFGLAASRLKVERTQPNVVMGKMAYMAPEQARGDAIDARVDLFACGVLLYELLVNERFYEAMTANDIWQVAGRGGFQPRSWPSIDPDLQGILSRALHPDHQRRHASCGEFREALLQYAADHRLAGAERTLRDRMEQVFAVEQAREGALMARFGTVTIASYRSALEATSVKAVNLVSSPSPSSLHGAKASAEPAEMTVASMPNPTSTLPAGSAVGSQDVTGEDPPQEQGARDTELASSLEPRVPPPPTPPTPPSPSTPLSAKPPSIHDERTMVTSGRVNRADPARRARGEHRGGQEATQLVHAPPPDEVTALHAPDRPAWLLPSIAVAAGAAIVCGVLLLSRSPTTNDPLPSPSAAVEADPDALAAVAPDPSGVNGTQFVADPDTPNDLDDEPSLAIPTSRRDGPRLLEGRRLRDPARRAERAERAERLAERVAERAVERAAERGSAAATTPVAGDLVSKRAWERLVRASPNAACVRGLLVARSKMSEAVFLRDHDDEIRRCAGELGVDL